jgi:uncharacterized protein
MLWSVRSATASVTLLGSVHVAKKEAYPLDPEIEKAFAESDTLVLEIPMDDAAKAAGAPMMLKAGMYEGGDSLEQHLDPATRKLFDKELEKGGMVSLALPRMKPWLAASTLLVMKLGELGYDPENGIDTHFQRRATERKMRVLALETMEEQLGLFTQMPENLQVKMLKETLEDSAELGPTMDRAFTAWQKGDEAMLEKELLAPMQTPEYKPLFDKIFTARNVKMVAKIKEYLGTSSKYFVIAGCGHMIAKGGIVDLLQREHIEVVER